MRKRKIPKFVIRAAENSADPKIARNFAGSKLNARIAARAPENPRSKKFRN